MQRGLPYPELEQRIQCVRAEKGLKPSQTPPPVPSANPTNEATALPQQKRTQSVRSSSLAALFKHGQARAERLTVYAASSLKS